MPANRQRQSRVLRWLTLVAVIVGVPSTLSYAVGAAFVLRMAKPALGAWWDAHQFYFMEGAATALGLLVAVRIGRGLINDPEMRTRCTIWAAILAVLVAAPLMHLCAAAARLDLGAFGVGMQSWIVGVAGYEKGKQLDKLLIAGIYFLKTAGPRNDRRSCPRRDRRGGAFCDRRRQRPEGGAVRFARATMNTAANHRFCDPRTGTQDRQWLIIPAT